jgi:hypothetical protein
LIRLLAVVTDGVDGTIKTLTGVLVSLDSNDFVSLFVVNMLLFELINVKLVLIVLNLTVSSSPSRSFRIRSVSFKFSDTFKIKSGNMAVTILKSRQNQTDALANRL